MITNSELPNTLLHLNMELNDYDFVLYHLLKSNEKYKQWAYNQRKNHPNRMMILDNSAYEFFVKGEELNMDDFAEVINDLRPDFYILPDVLMNKDKTVKGVKEFFDKYVIISSKPLAVAQGNTSEELLECLRMYDEMNIKYVAIPFHLSFYTEMDIDPVIRSAFLDVYKEETLDIRYAMGRVQWVQDHYKTLQYFPRVHFLGSHCPLEKKFYKEFYSMDTGYPVKLGIKRIGLEYEKCKPDIIIDEFLDTELDETQVNSIYYNVMLFKYY